MAVGNRAPARPHRTPISGFHAAPNDGTLHAVVSRLSSAPAWGNSGFKPKWTNVWARKRLFEVEVAGRLLLEPEAVVLGGVLEELGRFL